MEKKMHIYWFKYESIKWRILSESDGKATILAELILDSQAYQNECEYKNGYYYIKDTETYANNYEFSTIRAWLNDSFYNTAFTELQQAIINTVEVDNSVNNPCTCENTCDKVYLLSYTEVIFVSDTARKKLNSSYAKCMGAYTFSDAGLSCFGNGCWKLRSPIYSSGYSGQGRDICAVADNGSLNCGGTVDDVTYGIVPALQINLK